MDKQSAAPPVLGDYLGKFDQWLVDRGYSVRARRDQILAARSFMVRQLQTCPDALEEFNAVKSGNIYEHWRDWFASEDGSNKRVLPLDAEEKRAIQGAASRSGDNVPLKLRNAALVSMLMSPRPKNKHVRPEHIRTLKLGQIVFDDEKLATAYNVGDEMSQVTIDLDENARSHLNFYLSSSEGLGAVRPHYSYYLWPVIGNNKSMVGKSLNPISRQRLYMLIRAIGEDANIVGTLGPDVMHKEQPWIPQGLRKHESVS